MAVGTEHGGSLTLGTTGGTWIVNEINGHKETGDIVETTHLGSTTKRTYDNGDLTGFDTFDIEIQADLEAALPARGTKETVTLTKGLKSGETTAADIAGEAILKDVKYPDQKKGSAELGRAILTYHWTGVTGPTLTVAT